MSNLEMFQRNVRVFYWSELTRSLVFIVPIWVSFERQYISYIQLTFLQGIIFLTQLIFELPTGAFADLFGRKVSSGLGFLVMGLGVLITSFSVNFSQFLLGALFMGAGEALVSGAREALIYDTLKQAGKEDEFEKINSKSTLVFQLGLSCATLAGGFLSQIHFRLPWWGYAVGVTVAAILSFGFIEPKIDSGKFTLKNYLLQTKYGVKELLKTSHIRQISLFYILVGAISWACMIVFNNTLLVDVGHTNQEVGVIFAVVRVMNSLLLVHVLKKSAWFTRERTYLFFPIIMMTALLPGVWMSRWVAAPFIAASMMASTARWVILGKYTNSEFSSKYRATAISALSMAIGIIYVGFTFSAGYVMEHFGGTRTIFTLLGLLTAVSVLPLGIRLARAHRAAN